MKDTEQQAFEHLETLLTNVPFVHLASVRKNEHIFGGEIDFVLTVNTDSFNYKLVCEVKNIGQPHAVRQACAQLRYYCDLVGEASYGVFIAPYISPASQQICKDYGVGYLDFEGNCLLVFDHVYIERISATKPKAERRELRSLFAPKSAQVIRVLMRDPSYHWRVAELAEEANVSLGHVSNVRGALIERELASASAEGFYIIDPGALLDSWQKVYRRHPGRRHNYYTTMYGRQLTEVIRNMFQHSYLEGRIMLGSFSAAEWLAPYLRNATEFFYTDTNGLELLRSTLDLSTTSKGENIIIMELEDDGLFNDAIEPAPGIICTSPIQTYLDLCLAGPRGREAAEYLRKEKLQW